MQASDHQVLPTWRDTLRATADRWRRYTRRPDLWLREFSVLNQYRAQLRKARNTAEHAALYDMARTPLVTVRIATYNRARILTERTLPTVLAQTYANLEILIVGDHCTDDTEARVAALGDARIRFVNLPERGNYPAERFARWCVAGAAPMNYALEHANGEWLAPLDDDDEFTPDHVAVLLDTCRRRGLEMCFGVARMMLANGRWSDVGSLPLRRDHVCHSTVFYWSGLRFMPHEWNCWKMGEPGDWNLWRRMKWSGVHTGFVDQRVAIHHAEHTAAA